MDGEEMVGGDGGRIAIRIPSPETNMKLCLVCDDIMPRWIRDVGLCQQDKTRKTNYHFPNN